MSSLKRVIAQRRAAVIGVTNYAVSLDLTAVGERFASVTTLRFRCSDPDVGTFVDVAPHTLRSAVLNDRPLPLGTAFDVVSGQLRLTRADGLDEQNELVVDAAMTYSNDGEGMHRHVDPADGRTYLYAMSFLDAAPRWFACFDQPDLKAPLRLEVRTPPEWRVAGNGPAVELAPGHWTINSPAPLATYFTTLVAGPYHEVRDRHDGIELVLHVRQSLAEHLDRDAAELFAITKHCLDELHRLFGVRYPWGEYHQAFVPEFNAGAMENPGCVTLRDQMIFRSRATDADRADRAVTIAHEMAHMWFGDLVTLRWWDDLWLNESFAEYLGHRVIGPHTWTAFGIERKPWGYTADRRPSTHPVAGNGAVDAASALAEFDGISYAKGASVLRQLALQLGDDIFLDGLRRYISAHADGNAEFADLVSAWTAAGAPDLPAWTQVWLRTSGLDTLSVDSGELVRTPPDEARRRHTIAVARFDEHAAEVARETVFVTADRTPLHSVAGELVLPDAGDETWAKIALPQRTWDRMPALLPAIDDPRARGVVWNALQLAAADAEIDPVLALDIVVAALPRESDDVVAEVGQWCLSTVAGTYLEDAARPAAAQRLADTMYALTVAADAGSGRQLAAARIATGATLDADRLRDWLAGDRLPDGVAMDADLRWAVLLRLAKLGALSIDQLAAEAAADPSSAGAVHAARCRAARPAAAAKAAAWTVLMSAPETPNYQLYATAEGFWQFGQGELTAPYVMRYFAEIGDAVAGRTGWVAKRLALLAYPWPAVGAETLAATERLVADGSLHANVRRSVVDRGDDLRRALAVRERFSR